MHLRTSVPTDAEAILLALKPFLPRLRRVGYEAGSLSPWLHPELKALGIPAVCLETHHVRAAMSAQRNKTDAADALGLAHIVRTGWFKAAFIKSEPCYRMRLLLSQRRNLKRKFLDIENSIRHSLKAFGIRFKNTGRGGFEAAVREAVANDKLTNELMDAMLIARAALWKQYCKLHDLVVKLVARNELCRRFMAHSRGRSGDSPELHDGDRRSVAVPPLARCRRLLRPDVEALAVWLLDRHPGSHQQGRRPRCAARALRSDVGDADALQGKGQSQDMGAHAGETELPSQGSCRRGA